MISRGRFNRVRQAFIDRGVVDRIEERLRPAGKGGCLRALSVDVFLAGVVFSGVERKSLSQVSVHKVLTVDLARSLQIALGIRRPIKGQPDWVISERQVRYVLEAIDLKFRHTEGYAADLPADVRRDREGALQTVVNLIVEASVPDTLAATSSVSLDATAFGTWARTHFWKVPVDPQSDHAPQEAKSSRGSRSGKDGKNAKKVAPAGAPVHAQVVGKHVIHSFDRDARTGYQTKTYSNGSDRVHGFHILTTTSVVPVDADPDLRPRLIESVVLCPANANAAIPGLAAIDILRARGNIVNEVIADREFSMKRPESWVQPLAARGIKQVIDLHPLHHGVKDFNGIAMIDGTPHCLAALNFDDRLIKIERPQHLKVAPLEADATPDKVQAHEQNTKALAQYRELIAERRVGQFRRVAGPDADGNERWECPAQAGRVKCSNCPASEVESKKKIPVVLRPHRVPPLPPRPVNPGPAATVEQRAQYRQDVEAYKEQEDQLRCCRQRTVTIPANVTPALRQEHPWGSDAWIDSYCRRPQIEGTYGNLKSPKVIGLRRGLFFVVGLVKTSIMVACAVFAMNYTVLRTWAARTGDTSHPLMLPDAPQYGFEELDAEGNPDLATAPPPAA